MSTRSWLLENSYSDVIDLIDRIEQEWKKRGRATRRNWWDILAGGKDGKPRVVAGIAFPVLASAQLHEGRMVTRNALRRGPEEAPPDKDYRGRSAKKKKRSRERRLTKK